MKRLLAALFVITAVLPALGGMFDFWKPRGEPDWVSDLAARQKELPPSRFTVGVGTDVATSRRDGESRREAEAAARERIVAGLRKRFEAVAMDPAMGQQLAVTLAEAATVHRIYFEEETNKWYLLLALKHDDARAQAREQARRLLKLKVKALDALGKGALADYLVLYPLTQTAPRLQAWLAAADTFGSTPETLLHEEVARFTTSVTNGLSAVAGNVAVNVTLEEVGGADIPSELSTAFEKILFEHGIKVDAASTNQSLAVTISIDTDVSLKSLSVYRCAGSGMYKLTEGDAVLLSANITPNAETESSSSSLSVSQRQCMSKVLVLLGRRLAAALDGVQK